MYSSRGVSQTEYAAWSYTLIFASKMGWNGIVGMCQRALKLPAYNVIEIDSNYEDYSLPFH